MAKITKLFEPIKIGKLEVRNRIVMAPFPVKTAEDASMPGVIHDRYIDFYEERARGGVGLIVLPDTCVDRNFRFASHPCIGGNAFRQRAREHAGAGRFRCRSNGRFRHRRGYGLRRSGFRRRRRFGFRRCRRGDRDRGDILFFHLLFLQI